MCADRSADLSLSELVSVGRPPAHTGPWAAVLGCICVGPVSSFSWKQQGSSLPWEFPLDCKRPLFNLHSEQDGFGSQRKSNPFIGIHWISFSRLCPLSLAVSLLFRRFCRRVYTLLSPPFSVVSLQPPQIHSCRSVKCVRLIFHRPQGQAGEKAFQDWISNINLLNPSFCLSSRNVNYSPECLKREGVPSPRRAPRHAATKMKNLFLMCRLRGKQWKGSAGGTVRKMEKNVPQQSNDKEDNWQPCEKKGTKGSRLARGAAFYQL